MNRHSLKRNIITSISFILIILSLVVGVSGAHWITGSVLDAPDLTPADGHTVILFYEGDELNFNSDIIGTTSGSPNIYMVDAEQIPNHTWQVGDLLYVKVIDNGDGYITDFVTVTTTGSGWDMAPEMQLKKYVCNVSTFAITVMTDQTTYDNEDIVYISGNIINSTCDPVISGTLGIEIRNELTTTVFVAQIVTDNEGKFLTNFTLPTDALEGNYTVYVSYEGEQGTSNFEVNAQTSGENNNNNNNNNGGGGSGGSGFFAGPTSCTPVWECTSWSACNENVRTRTCTDSNNCSDDTDKPAESESCDEGSSTSGINQAINSGISCGDGNCQGEEDCETCSQDCGECEVSPNDQTGGQTDGSNNQEGTTSDDESDLGAVTGRFLGGIFGDSGWIPTVIALIIIAGLIYGGYYYFNKK